MARVDPPELLHTVDEVAREDVDVLLAGPIRGPQEVMAQERTDSQAVSGNLLSNMATAIHKPHQSSVSVEDDARPEQGHPRS